jgi:peptidoglycan-associated lipoprotein
MTPNSRNLLTALILAALLAGCSSGGDVRPDETAASAGPSAQDAAAAEAAAAAAAEAARLAAAADAAAVRIDPLDDPRGQLARRVIYFDFDRSDIKPEYLEVLAAHARYLVENPTVRVRLEGHADERGSREYNIGLGDRRAQAVRRILSFQGVASTQQTTVSYGEERPVADGHDEAAWTRNRRVELVYLR